MWLIILWTTMIALLISFVIMLIALFNAYEDTKMEQTWKPKQMTPSDDKLLLSRWELDRIIARMTKERKRRKW